MSNNSVPVIRPIPIRPVPPKTVPRTSVPAGAKVLWPDPEVSMILAEDSSTRPSKLELAISEAQKIEKLTRTMRRKAGIKFPFNPLPDAPAPAKRLKIK